MKRNIVVTLLFLVAFDAARAGEVLVRKIGEKAASVRELQDLYEERAEREERRAILERILAEAVWLEQVGGMKTARADALLALARWELLEFGAAPSYGFLGDDAGDARPALLVRTPGRDDLPEALARYRDRLLFIQLHNEGSQPILLGRPLLEMPGGLGEPKPSELGGVDTWPADLKALAKWGAWPERLDANGKVTLLAWLSPTQMGALSLTVPVRWSEEDDPPRQLRAVFLKESCPEDFARAQRTALQREKEVNKKLADLAVANAKKAKPDPELVKPPKPKEPVGPQIPPALGVVERAGGDQVVQVRLNDASAYEAGKELRVRKNERWVGVVRLDQTMDRDPNKKVYWATILDGDRDSLAGGSLHERP
jgi:hypothetical protein